MDNPREKNEIKEVIDYIQEKLTYAQRYIWSYFLISSILFLFVCTYYLWPLLKTINFSNQIDFDLISTEYWVIIILLVMFIVISIIQVFGFIKKSTKLKSIKENHSLGSF